MGQRQYHFEEVIIELTMKLEYFCFHNMILLQILYFFNLQFTTCTQCIQLSLGSIYKVVLNYFMQQSQVHCI